MGKPEHFIPERQPLDHESGRVRTKVFGQLDDEDIVVGRHWTTHVFNVQAESRPHGRVQLPHARNEVYAGVRSGHLDLQALFFGYGSQVCPTSNLGDDLLALLLGSLHLLRGLHRLFDGPCGVGE